MKKLFLMLALALGVSMVSCQKTEEITVSPATLAFSATAGSQNVSVTGATGSGLSASADQAWCKPSVNATTVIVEVEANPNEASRTATVTISFKGTNATVAVTQDGLSADFSALQSEVTVEAKGGNVVLGSVVSNVTPEVVIPEGVDWVINPTVSAEGEIAVTVSENDGESSRRCVLTVNAGAATQDVVINQEAVNVGMVISHEEKGDVIGGVNVQINVEILGNTTDFRIMVLGGEGLNYSPSDIMDMLKSGSGSVYDKATYDEAVASGGFIFTLDKGVTYRACGYAMDDSGNESELVDYRFSTDPGNASEAYKNWIGDWTISYTSRNNPDGTGELSIVEASSGSTYTMYGWEGVQFQSQDGSMSYMDMNAAFDPQTNNFVVLGGQSSTVLQLEDGTAVYTFPAIASEINDDGSVSAYIFSGGELLQAEWGDGEIDLEPIPFDTEDNGSNYIGLGMGFFGVDANANPVTLLSSGLDWWLYPYTITMTKVSSVPTHLPTVYRYIGDETDAAVVPVSDSPSFYSNVQKVFEF